MPEAGERGSTAGQDDLVAALEAGAQRVPPYCRGLNNKCQYYGPIGI